MTYRRKLEDFDQTVGESSSAKAANPRPPGDLAGGSPTSLGISGRDDSVDEEIHHYTRVQIQAQLLLLSDERQGTADTSDHFSDDEMSASMINLDDMSPMIDLEPTGAGKSAMSKASPKINEDTSSAEPLDIPTIDLEPTGAGKSAISKASPKINEDTSSAEPLDIPTTDPEPTVSGNSDMSKASAKISKDTSSAEPLDMATKSPAPQPRWGGGRGVSLSFWVCHECHNFNNSALSPINCSNCPHYRCLYCQRC